MKHEITYLGKTYKSNSGFEIISDQEFEKIVSEWYKKPSKEEVLNEMVGLRHGNSSISVITKYYFRKLMDNTLHYKCKWSINEVMKNKEALSIFVDKNKKNDKVFTSNSIVENLDTVFRLGGKGIATKVAQFPVKAVDFILEKYNINNNWYDYSCGWGGRLAGALKNKVNYYGTDPNYLLCDKLAEFANDYKTTQFVGLNPTATHIKCQGSEKFIPEWENKMGLAFSSPPYFLLEDYRIGEQSYTSGVTNYQMWINDYLKPTFENIYKYLIQDGFFIINIKDFDKYELEKDSVETAEKCGFYLYTKETLSNNKRNASVGNGEFVTVDNDETIYVFCKKGFSPKEKIVVQTNLFDFM